MKKILLTSCVLLLVGASAFSQNKPAAKQAPQTKKTIAALKTDVVKTTADKKSSEAAKIKAANQTPPAAASLAEWNASKSGN